MLNLMKKNAATVEKTAIKMTPAQKKTTTVANVSGKVKNVAFGVATGAGVAGSMMLQNERHIKGRKAREAYHRRVEEVCTVAVGAAVVGAGAAIIQGIFDPVIDVTTFEIEPEAYVELNDKGSEIQEKAAQNSNADEPVEDEGAADDDKTDVAPEQNADQHVEKVVAEIVQTEQPASAPKDAEKPIVEATATEVKSEQTPAAPADKQPVAPAPKDATPAPKAEQPAEKTPADKQPAPVAPQTEQPKSDADKQKPNGNSQGASNNNPKNGNNHAKAAK
jgi:hypothetical protein